MAMRETTVPEHRTKRWRAIELSRWAEERPFMIRRLICAVLAGCLPNVLPSVLYSQTVDAHAESVLLLMPEPPDDFLVTKQRITADDKELGVRVAIVNEESESRVIVTVETAFDRSSTPARVAATKAYVNSTAVAMKEAGFDLTESKFPDIERETFAAPVQVDMTFTNSEGGRICIRQYIFFTDKGFSVLIRAPDMSELEKYSKWAKNIRPASDEAADLSTASPPKE
jgi:hypothetical protein